MRGWLMLGFVVAWLPSQAFADPVPAPVQTWDDAFVEIDAFAPTTLSAHALLAMAVPRLVLDTFPRARRSILDNPFMHALFKGVTLNSGPDERVMMLAVRPAGPGGVLRFRVRFDSALIEHTPGPLRRFLMMRRPDV